MIRYYVGLRHGVGKGKRVVFRSAVTPTIKSHGQRYAAVIGPFRTKRAAVMMATFGSGNPHLQTVLDAERMAKRVTLNNCEHGVIQASCSKCHPQGNILREVQS